LLRIDSKSSAVWGHKLRRVAEQGMPRLTLGGEHFVTFPLLEVLAQRHPGLRLVVLDAHHDAYDYPLLTHYSLFHYAHAELGLEVLMVGVRHELEKCTAGVRLIPAERVHREGLDAIKQEVFSFIAGAPFYFSIDLDVISPEEFPSVSDPIAGGLSIETTTALARAALRVGPVAADLVEYNSLRDPDGQCLARIAPILEEYAAWLG
jgi:agmatinase